MSDALTAMCERFAALGLTRAMPSKNGTPANGVDAYTMEAMLNAFDAGRRDMEWEVVGQEEFERRYPETVGK